MKRLYQERKWKRYSARKALSELVAKSVRGKKKSRTKDSFGKVNVKDIQIEVPENYSLINNYEGLLKHFELIADNLKNRCRILLDFRKIKNLTPDSIAFLVSKVRDQYFNRGNNIGGNNPENEDFQLMFKQSGFYSHVISTHINLEDDKNLLIHKVTRKKVHPKIAKSACLVGVRHTFGNDIKFPPIYEILIECMANTRNHASSAKNKKYDWWLFVYKNDESKVTSYTFIDLGVGVFKSLSVETYIEKALEKTGIKSNMALIPKLLIGEISSRTSQGERGKGFPLIHENSKHNNIKKVILMTNDIYADIKRNKYTKSSFDLSGTILYLELAP